MDRIHRLPRIWSNEQLATVAPLFTGEVVNVSAWQDSDKEDRRYRDYFVNAKGYSITNFKAELRGLQNVEHETFLDLEADLPADLVGRWDVVFNHTTLEHVYEFRKAFANLCAMTRDIVIVVVPFLQQYHGDYGDYWRFSPLAVKRMFEDERLECIYLSYNGHLMSSVYIFAIAAKHPERWRDRIHKPVEIAEHAPWVRDAKVGSNAVPNFRQRGRVFLNSLLSRVRRG